MALLEIHDLHAYYGNIHALKGVSLTVEDGEIVTLIGGNGAGKTTTLNAISGIVHARSGRIVFDGAELGDVPAHAIVSRGVIQVPEGRRTFSRLTVDENLRMGGYILSQEADVREGIDRAYEMFPRLKERRTQVAGTLSGGEPSMGLAPTLVDYIFDTIRTIHASGTAILLVEQNALMALEVGNRGYILQTGQIVLADNCSELRDNEQVKRAYLGV
jgi:branched-chain amino acid transport system ATP-binding protein